MKIGGKGVVLVGVCAAIGVHLLSEGWPTAPTALRLPATTQPQIVRASADALETDILKQRPLFAPHRRLYEAETTPVVNRISVPPTPVVHEPYFDPGLKLVGVAGDPAAPHAIIVTPYGQARNVRVGDDVSGWTVHSITDGLVIMSFRKKRRRLTIYADVN